MLTFFLVVSTIYYYFLSLKGGPNLMISFISSHMYDSLMSDLEVDFNRWLTPYSPQVGPSSKNTESSLNLLRRLESFLSFNVGL